MADLKYFIRESQRFRAGTGNVEEGMMGERDSLCISALWWDNGINVAHFRKPQQKGIRMAGRAFVFVDNAVEYCY